MCAAGVSSRDTHPVGSALTPTASLLSQRPCLQTRPPSGSRLQHTDLRDTDMGSATQVPSQGPGGGREAVRAASLQAALGAAASGAAVTNGLTLRLPCAWHRDAVPHRGSQRTPSTAQGLTVGGGPERCVLLVPLLHPGKLRHRVTSFLGSHVQPLAELGLGPGSPVPGAQGACFPPSPAS